MNLNFGLQHAVELVLLCSAPKGKVSAEGKTDQHLHPAHFHLLWQGYFHLNLLLLLQAGAFPLPTLSISTTMLPAGWRRTMYSDLRTFQHRMSTKPSEWLARRSQGASRHHYGKLCWFCWTNDSSPPGRRTVLRRDSPQLPSTTTGPTSSSLVQGVGKAACVEPCSPEAVGWLTQLPVLSDCRLRKECRSCWELRLPLTVWHFPGCPACEP